MLTRTERPKILFLINNFGVGGAERVFLNQINHLDREKFEITLATVTQGQGDDFLGRIQLPPEKIVCFNFKRFWDFAAWQRAVKFVRQERFHIIYATINFANLVARGLSFFAPDAKIIIRETNIATVKRRKDKLADKLLKSRVSRVVANSSAVKESLLNEIKLDEKKIAVIPNGVDLENRKLLDKKQLRAARGLSNDDYLILNVASLKTAQKGQTFLIKALAELVDKHQQRDIKLLLVGGGSLIKPLSLLAAELGITDKVIFCGQHPDPSSFYQMADLFILPSLWEGSPNVLLEAMSWGLPAVATAVGGVGEIVKDGESGLIVRPKDVAGLVQAILKLKSEPNLAKKFGEAAKKTIEKKYSLKNNLELLENLFFDVLK